MLILLSPAKSLDYETPPSTELHSVPALASEAAQLIEVLRGYTPAQLASLMDLSDALASLNVARYAAWQPHFSADNSKQAVLAFNGDVYEGLEATTLSEKDLGWAQTHVRILSGLYGVLRPLDWMQPYRLEMGTRLPTSRGKDLYGWWGDRLVEELHRVMAEQGSDLILNLASQEYFKAVKRKSLRARVVECVFEDWKSGQWRIISFHAKRARGLMARHAIVHRVRDVSGLLDFQAEGYAHDAAASTDDRLVFRRRLSA